MSAALRDSDGFLRNLTDDGLYLPSIKEHSLEKIHRHNYLARMFATGTKYRWPQRAYIGLYSGAGRARVESTGEIVETTALSVFRLPDPFTKYIFVDSDLQCTQALKKRIAALPGQHDPEIILGDANEQVGSVLKALPRFSRNKGLLSFCFVDPFAANLKFRTIRALGTHRKMDFLILLMLGNDARRNFRRYHDDPSDTRIADLIDCPEWREEYRLSDDTNIVRFLLRKFDTAMTNLGYRNAQPEHYHRVTAAGTGVMQYILILYSRHELGQAFWESTLAGSTPQLDLGL